MPRSMARAVQRGMAPIKANLANRRLSRCRRRARWSGWGCWGVDILVLPLAVQTHREYDEHAASKATQACHHEKSVLAAEDRASRPVPPSLSAQLPNPGTSSVCPSPRRRALRRAAPLAATFSVARLCARCDLYVALASAGKTSPQLKAGDGSGP